MSEYIRKQNKKIEKEEIVFVSLFNHFSCVLHI